jgi:hypothetical protein
VSLYYGSKGDCSPVEGVVGPIQQVDPGVHPYPHHMLSRTVSAQGLAGPRPCQSEVAIHV